MSRGIENAERERSQSVRRPAKPDRILFDSRRPGRNPLSKTRFGEASPSGFEKRPLSSRSLDGSGRSPPLEAADPGSPLGPSLSRKPGRASGAEPSSEGSGPRCEGVREACPSCNGFPCPRTKDGLDDPLSERRRVQGRSSGAMERNPAAAVFTREDLL